MEKFQIQEMGGVSNFPNCGLLKDPREEGLLLTLDHICHNLDIYLDILGRVHHVLIVYILFRSKDHFFFI